MVADDNDMQDWADDCDSEGQEQVVRDIRNRGVVMVAVTKIAAGDNDSKGGQGQQRTTMACKIRRWTTTGKDKSGQGETAETAE